MTKRAPSSSFVTNAWTYHVFLSFRGADTRFGFTNNLHQALVRKGIRSFIDHEELQVGEEISPGLAKAIEGSRIAIIIFSENYASSTFCLEELVEILKHIKGKGRLVWPIFYKVDPCNVRHIKVSYKEAFDNLEKRFGNNSDKIEMWKEALYKAANLKGEHFTGSEYEYDFIGRIVQQVSRIINRQPLHISVNYLVDLESRVQKLITHFNGESDEIKSMVGICGVGGIGKTTIACAVFNLMADLFEGLCFLPDVRENSIGKRGLVKLQQALLFEILEGKSMKFIDECKGSQIIKDRLQQKKILLVLDDIDKLRQLKSLAGGLDWFGPGSRIIITTRDRHLLRVHGVERIYEVEGLNDADAYELFCWNAFKENNVDSCRMNIAMRAVRYCKGLPLALDIIGCNLFNKTIKQCKSALDEYERSPNEEIQKILKVSYDGLEENEKEIFLDMACFFNGYKLSDVKDILKKGRDINPEFAISQLVEKSLINIYLGREEHIVSMHDLIRDMGREIVRKESKSNLGERSRLWYFEDILNVLQENKGTDRTEFIMLDSPEDEQVEWNGEAFKDMKNLRVLIIKHACFSEEPKHLPNSLRILDWTGYPSSSLPQNFYPRDLAMLNLPNCVLALDKPLQKLNSLTHMDLSNNRLLKQLPDMSGAPNLRRLNLEGCLNLTEVHHSIGQLDRIRELHVAGCSKLSVFPHSMKSTNLTHLDLSGCLSLPSFPKFVATDLVVSVFDDAVDNSTLLFEKHLELGSASLSTRISMFSKLDRLISGSDEGSSKVTSLLVQKCHWIDGALTAYFSWFRTLEVLSLVENELTDEFFFTRLPWFPNLTMLDLTANDFTTLPECINQCCLLRTLLLDRCYKLREIRGIPSSVKHLSTIGCTKMTLQSLSLLSNEKLHESGGTNFTMPGSRIPNWFHYHCKGSSICFWFRKKFPMIALCIVYSAHLLSHLIFFTIKLYVNGHEIESKSFLNSGHGIKENVHLFDFQNTLQSLSSDNEAMKEYIKDGWNHAELKLKGYVRWMGVYVYKQNHDKEDVRFSNPMIL